MRLSGEHDAERGVSSTCLLDVHRSLWLTVQVESVTSRHVRRHQKFTVHVARYMFMFSRSNTNQAGLGSFRKLQITSRF